MSNIKPGDLVMVVKPTPCCGDLRFMGLVSAAQSIAKMRCRCGLCGHIFKAVETVEMAGRFMMASCLKKIDPPAEGDSLPTSLDLRVAA